MRTLSLTSILLSVSLTLAGCGGGGGGGGGGGTADTTAPTILIVSPGNNDVCRDAVTINVNAIDNVSVAKVELYVNNTKLSENATFPYSFTWNTTSLQNGAYSLSAKAYDGAGNSATASINVTVNNVVADTAAPTVAITYPAASAVLNGTIPVLATASDNVGVSRVELFVDGVSAGSDSSFPYQISWNSTASGSGTHELTATAHDAAGNSQSSSPVTVTVDATAPAVAITSPAASSTVNGVVSVTANATDNVGISKVEFYVDGQLAGSDNSTPYSFNWNSASSGAGAHQLTAKAYDTANNSQTSSSVSVTVDTSLPAVSITSPADNSTVNGTITIQATASDNSGINRVEFYIDGAVVSTDSTAPYAHDWNSSSARGTHTLYAKVFDLASNSTTSSSITVTSSDTVTVKVKSVASSQPTIYGIDMTITLPTGVSFSSAVASGVAAGKTLTPFPSGQNLSISLIAQDLVPFGLGEFMTLTGSLASGTAVTPNNFSIVHFGPFDGGGNVISGVTAELYR